jgi:large subunit ribosomal protein L18
MIYGGNVKMAKSGNYRVQLRRRREGKTDYQARKALVISGKPRLVTRASLKNVTVQITVAKPHGDEILASANSRELIKNYGWKAPTGNVPAAYLTGLLCGLKAKTKGVEQAILDIGLLSPTKGSKIFAILSGVLDAGVDVPHSEEKIVKERMKGEHIAKYAKSLGSGSEEYTAKFSKYTAQNVAPEKISEHFNKVKAEITGSFKAAKGTTEEKKAPAVEEASVEEKKASIKKAAAKPKTAAKEPAAPKEKASKKGEKKA